MTIDDVSIFLGYFLSALSYLLAIPFFYIVIVKSTPQIHIYRNTILNLATWYCIAIFIYAVLFQPIFSTLPNKLCAKFIGLASPYGVEGNIVALFIFAITTENVVVAICICFFYRYNQIRAFIRPGFMESYKGLLLCMTVHVAMSIMAAILTWLIVWTGEIIHHRGITFLCYDLIDYSNAKKISIAMALFFASQAAAIVCLAFITIRQLRSQKLIMTKRTYRLHIVLTVNLLVVLALPILFDVVPVLSLCYMIYIKADSLYLWDFIANHSPFMDVLLTFSVTLLFVTPYRKAVKDLLCKETSPVAPAHRVNQLF
ncbi:hypothetical protein QR680_015451 [Steinernema hermaphroditum]|uniref:Uncharacterized protein n=1 Tax=Steinernema hermaphroditum TaxID=289476 RepID=A0AA39LKV4_9BILA|nr:hypothetical protein QR680_015451 [Steinernema hermaphroditum]